MYFNFFQSGKAIELFNPNNKDLVSNWKFIGKNYKSYDNLLRCSSYVLGSGGLSRMQLPNKPKDNLGIIQSYLVFQLYLFSPNQFTIEIAILDTKNTKRRLIFATRLRELSSNYFSSLIPMIDLPLGIWINLSIDVLSFVCDCFKFLTFKSIDSICLSANCKVRKIFTMRNRLICDSNYNTIIQSEGHKQGQGQREEGEKNKNDSYSFHDNEIEKVPLNLDLPSRANSKAINLNVEKVYEQIRSYQNKREGNIRYNQNYSSDHKEIKKRVSPSKYYGKKKISPNMLYLNHVIVDDNLHLNQNNYLITKKQKNKKKRNKKKKGNSLITKKVEKVHSVDNRIQYIHNKNKDLIDMYNHPDIKFQFPLNFINEKTEKRYQDNNTNEEVKDNQLIFQQQTSLDRINIAKLNNFLYNSKIKLQKQNTMESCNIEEINIYASQMSLNQKDSGIIQVDNIINKEEETKNKNDRTKQSVNLFKYMQEEKDNKKKIIKEMLDDNPFNNVFTTSIERPYSPPINNKNIDEENIINNNLQIDRKSVV